MTRRPGLSLAEVLVALFIMAIGTIALLTLFPVGAVKMGEAFKDDRTYQAADQGNAYMRTVWNANVVSSPTVIEQFEVALDNPGGGLPALTPAMGEPSYPVVVDPIGFNSRTDASQSLLGDGGSTTVPRRSIKQVQDAGANALNLAKRTCTLLDGMTYTPDGVPGNSPTSLVDRDVRYNWLWVIQRPNSSDRTKAAATVVVFDKRVAGYVAPNSEEVFAPSYAQPGETRLSFAAGTRPKVRAGGWIMDATIAPTLGVRNARFYRVVSVTDDGSGGTDIELQTPLEDTYNLANTPPVIAPADRRIVVPAGVAEVFVMPTPLGQ
jgi:hypothetical protein